MVNAPYPIVPQAQPASWRDRHPHLKIALGAGVLLALVCVPLVLVFASLRGSDVYKEALARAQASPQVEQRLGKPIEPGWFMTGHLNVNGDRGNADISIPISGPRGQASIRAVGFKSHGVWKIQQMYVLLEGNPESIDLLTEQP